MNPIEHLPVSRLICPKERFEYSKLRSCKKIYILSLIIDDSDEFSYVKDHNSSYSGHQLYPLFWCNNKEYSEDEFCCGACQCKSIGTTYYFCIQCEFSYHKECVESLPLIKSLYHRKHNLQLLMFSKYVDFNSDITYIKEMAMSCCHCGSDLLSLFYHCSLCNFSIDLVCARKPSFLTYKKRHEHTLTYFPRRSNLICDVCGLPDDNKSLIYVCLQCDFVVHKFCIYLPFTIRISRHEHRISFTYSSLSTKLSCGVCRQNVDENCGKYSCMKDCTYVVHSMCATRKDVWDGKELEDEPEEVDEHLNSFEVIDDGVIQHFSHPHHHLRFENGTEMSSYDEKRKCEACILPLYDGGVYECMDPKCDFVLHEACANLPRAKQHMAFPYPLTLQISGTTKIFFCELCYRYSFGFKYEISRHGDEVVEIDVRCAAISEPFHHQCHPMHPLFLLTVGISKTCSVCRGERYHHLNCLECDFVLCFDCATLPYKVRYEYDDHFLTISYEENASLNWCEVCEKTIHSPEWLYTCNECGVALHIYCLRGRGGYYMKPAQNIELYSKKINIVPNYGLTRPICCRCGRHCQDQIRFETLDGRVFCSYRHTV